MLILLYLSNILFVSLVYSSHVTPKLENKTSVSTASKISAATVTTLAVEGGIIKDNPDLSVHKVNETIATSSVVGRKGVPNTTDTEETHASILGNKEGDKAVASSVDAEAKPASIHNNREGIKAVASSVVGKNGALTAIDTEDKHDSIHSNREGIKAVASSVVGKKGAPTAIDTEDKHDSIHSNREGIKAVPAVVESNDKINKTTLSPASEDDINISKNMSKEALPTKETPTTTKKVKKPTKLVYEDLAALVSLKEQETSSKTVIDQMPSPNNDNDLSKTMHSVTSNSHPGLVIPIVTTILVVPMFAVVGYMALRRAKEAWKNRHYKRMDFLLDGMYND